MDKAVGFTDKQRAWFLERDNYQCMMHTVVQGRWTRCKNTKLLQVHHITPRGHSSMHYPKNFPVNGAYNGIVLCAAHHIALGVTGETIYCIHPDTEIARIAFKNGDKNAYKTMMEKREELNKLGLPYWNTMWDLMFKRLIQKRNVSFLRNHKYPGHKKYGSNGR